MEKKCSRCQKEFSCQANASCWCQGYAISPSVAKQMKKDYQDCLCEACLLEHEAMG